MTFIATVYRLLIASPADLKTERDAIEKAIHEWNSANAFQAQAILLPVRWETDAIPETGGRPQEFINNRLVEPSDLIIGVFWTRVGSSTGKEESGTIEEIKKGLNDGKKVLLYFSNKPVPPNRIDREQHRKLEEFKKWCKSRSLYHEFRSSNELNHVLGRHLTEVIRDIKQSSQSKGSNQREDEAEPALGVYSAIPTLLNDAAETEFIRQSVGDSPLDTGLLRRDLSGKACLKLTNIGKFTLDPTEIHIPFSISNVGRYPAQEVMLNVENAGESIFRTLSPITTIAHQGAEQGFSLRVPRGTGGPNQEPESWTFVLTATFNDYLGKDQAEFAFRLEGTDPNFKVYEDVARAKMHALCGWTRR